jgi:hypothetical protein
MDLTKGADGAASPYSSEGAGHSSPDEIFGRMAEEAAVETHGAEDAGDDSAVAEPEPEWMETAPEEFKTLSSQANVSKEIKKWLKDSYGELQDFKSSAYGSKEAIQELSELFPGGVEDLRAASETVQAYQREKKMLESGDPDQMNEILEEKLVGNPDAFLASLHGSLDALKRSNLMPEYNEIAVSMAHEGLESVTDGHFGAFFDGLVGLAQKYASLSQTNPEEAAKIAAQLANQGLSLADWWAGAKNKLGFGEKTGQPDARTIRAGAKSTPVVRPSQTDEREYRLAEREVRQFNDRLADAHTRAISPLITTAAKRELAAAKIELSAEWLTDLTGAVDSAIKQNLASDSQFQALMNRTHYGGNRQDIRTYNLSDQAIKTMVDAARLRASKLIPGLVKKYVAKLAQLNPQAKAVTPGAAIDSGGWRAASGAKQSAQDALKDRKLSVRETLDRILN